ncbi:MAG TPA: ISL3 family transposase [Nakamurella sp.]|nr:ISL3 family transposase [Nakamurella sp.]
MVIDRVDWVDRKVVIAAHPRARGSRCRRCARVSTRVHSRYRRQLADLPASGRPVVVWLAVRRFFCDHVDCSVCTFVEQVPGLTERHARRSPGLQAALVAVGLALAGRAGSRLATRLGMGVSRSTLLRMIRALPDPPVGQVTVLGVDEFALRRGRQYGTVLVDLAGGHRPVDVLLGREAGDFADWLRAHPGVEVICRDRAGGYADGARGGAPDAVQVADRWHLWDNLCRHVERLVAAHHACLPEPTTPATDHGADDPPDPAVLLQWPDTVRVAHARQRYQQIHDLHEQGLSMRAIARRLDVNFKTVRRYVRASSVDVLVAGGVQVSVLGSFKPYLNDRLAEGERNATRLLGEITGQGYTGGYNTLARYLRPLRRLDAATLADLPARPAPPAVRQVTGWITGLPSNLDPDTAVRLQAIRARCPELDAAVRHVAGFARMIKDLSGEENTLTKWIGAVDADLPALRSFTAGLRRDLNAVVAGLTMGYNSGAVEGTVNRVKQLKAAMYGRAKPDLLRKLILLA